MVLDRLPAIDASLFPLAETTEPPWRAVIGVPGETGKATLAALHELGVRGVRFDLGAAPADGLDPLLRLADRIVPLGWHIELHLAAPGAGRALSKAEWQLMQLPLALCFSGAGGFAEGRRAEAADLDVLLGLLQLGRYWLKLSGADLAPRQLNLWDEAPPLARALQSVRTDRLIWGSGKQTGRHCAIHLASGLAMLDKFLPHPGDRHRVLVDNPASLYGFASGATM